MPTLSNETIPAGTTYTTPNGTTTDVLGTIVDDGTIEAVGGAGNNGILSIDDAVSLTGPGVLIIDTITGGGALYVEGNGNALTNTSTIEGAGIIGNGNLVLINNGLVDAAPESGSTGLTLNGGTITDGSTSTSSGTLEATGGATLYIDTSVVTAYTGYLSASGAGSVVQVNNNATLYGLTLSNTNGGVLETGNGASLDIVTVTAGSTYVASNGATTTLYDTINNQGTINLNGGDGNNGVIVIGNAVVLGGGGTLTMSTDAAGGGSAYLEGNGNTLTLDPGTTIQGTGIIGNGNLVIDNLVGLIDATPEGGTVSLTLNGGGITNNSGVLEASAGGTLVINTTVYNEAGAVPVRPGAITVADAASTVALSNADIQGGTLNNSNGGTLETENSTTLDGVTLAALTLSASSTLLSLNGQTTYIVGAIVNDGTVTVDGGDGNNGVLVVAGATTLSGGGTVVLDTAAGGGAAYLEGNGNTLSNTSDTIEGTGVFGNGNLVLINTATVDATPESGTTTLTLNGGAVYNSMGLLEASAGGTLVVNTTVYNAGGTIAVADGVSTVTVSNADIQGGTLTNGAGGTFESINSTTLDGSTLGALTLSSRSTLLSPNGQTTYMLGSIINDGTITVDGGAGNNGVLVVASNTSLSGGGTLVLDTAAGGGAAFLEGNGNTLTNTNNTILGTGVIGNGNLVLINQATVDATPFAGVASLTLNGGPVTNAGGLLEASAGGLLILNTTILNGSGDITVADAASTVVLSNADIQGGTINNTAGGTLEATNSTTLDGVTAGALTLDTNTLLSPNGQTTYIMGAIANDGTITVDGGNGSNGVLVVAGNTTLSGGGAIVLDTATGGGAAYLEGNGNTLTNTNNTILGTGVIGNGNLVLINQATVDATPEGGTSGLTLNGSPVTNAGGLLEASGGGTLTINTTIYNGGGTITVADAASTVQLTNADIQGGTISDTPGSTLDAINSTTLDGSTLGALTLSNGSVLLNPDGQTTYMAGSIVNDGTITVDGGDGNNGVLVAAGNTTLSGGGTLLLDTAASGGASYLEGNGNTLINTNDTIEGTGVIGNGNLVLINQATVDATPEGGTTGLTLNGGPVTNAGGVLEASGGGTLNINTTINNDIGLITVADATSSVLLNNADILGGTINDTAGGTIEAQSSTTLDGITEGALTLSSGSTLLGPSGQMLYIVGSIVNHGTITIDGGAGNNAVLVAAGATTLSGGGTIVLDTATGGGASYLEGNGNTLTNTSDTIEGTGVIGNGNLVLINSGTVDATPESGTTGLTLNGGAITNTGVLEATNGADLSVQTSVGGSGIFEVGAGSEVDINAATSEAATFADGTGKLRLDNPAGAPYSGTIGGFSGTDILELANTTAVFAGPSAYDATTNTTTLTVTLNNNTTQNYTLAGDYSAAGFQVTGSGNDSDITLTTPVTGALFANAPGAATVGIGQPGAISGVSLSESPTVFGETFTAVVADTSGVLSAVTTAPNGGGTIVASKGATTLTISGTLAQVTADLGTLTATEATTAPDSLSLNASDSSGGVAMQATTAITVNSPPAITTPRSATVNQSAASPVSGIGLAESGNTAGETFTVVVGDAAGTLSASGALALASNDLLISGSLGAVNSALATLTDTEAGTAGDTISISAQDSFGNAAPVATVPITVIPTITLMPVITAPANATVLQANATAISGVSVSEPGLSASQTITVTLADNTGDLFLTGAGVTGSGTTSVTVTGSVAQVNAALATLTDTDTTTADTIGISARDSLNNSAAGKTILASATPLTAVLAAPGVAAVAQNVATAISGVSLSEASSVPTETYTIVVDDTHGDLEATGTGVSGYGTTSLDINGTLAAVNAALATLTDTDASTAADTIVVNANDSFGNVAASKSIAVSVTPAVTVTPVITAPGAATVTQANATPITGVSLAEPGAAGGTTYTVSLVDMYGDLAATGAGVSDAGSTTLFITGSLAQVNADLATLTDTDSNPAADTITLNAHDSLNTSAAPQSIAIAVTALTPVLAAPASATVTQANATAVSGVTLAETNAILGESFTVRLSNENGLLSATGAGVSGSGTPNLMLAGSLAQVNADLATLTDNALAATDTITAVATDSLGNTATGKSIAVTVTPLTPVLSAPGAVTITQGTAVAISGITLAETGYNPAEVVSATLSDGVGDLAVADDTAPFVSGSGSTSLTITGSLAQVNAALATLTDTDSSAAADTITVAASDSIGNTAASKSIAITVTPTLTLTPAISAAGAATVTQANATAITGVSLAENGSAGSATFTTTLKDTNGLLAVTGTAGVTGSGTNDLVLTGSLSAINSDLATLTDTDSKAPSDTIEITASDSLSNTAAPASIAVTITPLVPVLTVPSSATIEAGTVAPINGITLTETGNTLGETFTVTLKDANGLLSASGTGVTGSGSTGLTIAGSLAVVNADLATLTDEASSAAGDTIAIAATDSYGNTATTAASIPVSVTLANNPAVAELISGNGVLTAGGTPNSYVLNLGDVTEGSATVAISLEALNAAIGPADGLGGSFTITGGAGFTNTGFGVFSGVGAGADSPTNTVSLSTSNTGDFSETIVLHPTDSSSGGGSTKLPDETVTITGSVVPSGTAQGDVHLVTFDGLHYDFQAVGDFTLAQSTVSGDTFRVQIQTAPNPTFNTASSITEVAAQVGNSVVTFGLGNSGVSINGILDTSLNTTHPTQLLGGGELQLLSATRYELTWSTGETLTVTNEGPNLDVAAGLGSQDGPGSVQGLLGSFTGQASDIALPDGTVLPQPVSTSDLLGVFANAWTVAPDASLLNGSVDASTSLGASAPMTFLSAGPPSEILTGSLEAGDQAGPPVTFLGTLSQLAGRTVVNFAPGDLIDVKGLTSTRAAVSYTGSATAGSLAITAGADSAVVHIAGDLAGGAFHTASDQHGGTLISYS